MSRLASNFGPNWYVNNIIKDVIQYICSFILMLEAAYSFIWHFPTKIHGVVYQNTEIFTLQEYVDVH
jgi:hypothetical protein